MNHRRFTQSFVLCCGFTAACAALASVPAFAQDDQTLVVTASNTASNSLLVYDTAGTLRHTIATGGSGGVSGNSGGIAVAGDRIAVVNFGSQNVSLFTRSEAGIHLGETIPATSSPVSVAFGHGHLYVLGTTTVESHAVSDFGISAAPDGVATLLKADGSAAQVGVLEHQLIVTEKSNVIETFGLNGHGAVIGAASPVSNIPANVNAPFGLVTRDNEAYVTIAHANEISLVRHHAVVTTTGSGTQMAPCWLALDGPYLFSSNSPSKSVSRYLAHGNQIVQEEAVAASFNGSPTDIAYVAGWVAVVDGAGAVSHVSVFRVDGDGELAKQGSATIASAANGVAVLPPQ